MRRATPLLLLGLVLGLVACGIDATTEPAPSGTAPAGPDDGSEEAEDARRAVADGHEIVLEHGATRRTLATLEPERDGELEHVALRPGAHPTDTVLALTRTDGRYELRYLVVDDGDVSDLYWFPWRLQVDDRLVEHHDAPPRPVWSPDGATVAWLEWDEQGTRVRTVDWMPDEEANNPSDDTATHRLADVPVGTQLERWDEAAGAATTLVGRNGDVVWRIELRSEDAAVAMPVATTPDESPGHEPPA